jgi:ubiquinone/menaquinone biosynthesis C-methylase UbiE
VKRDFGGEAAGYYQRYRHGYPSAVTDALVGAFKLTGQDVVIDLGCGTGQLTLPMARHVRAVIGVDVEPDMLEHARQAALDGDVRNVMWMLGGDTDIPALRLLLGDRSAGAVTIAQALHWMNHQDLFRAVVPLVRPGGGIAVVTNGIPLWLQETDWSRALREFLENWLGATLTSACGTDERSQQRYIEDLTAAGFEVSTTAVDYLASLDMGQLVGSVCSAMGSRLPPASQRPTFAEQVRAALAPHDRFYERVHVAILVGTAPSNNPRERRR